MGFVERYCTLKEVLELNITDKNVLVIGCPASGKTWLSGKLKTENHELIHTDNFIDYGYEVGMYCALDAIISVEKPTLAEGVFGYRILRKGLENGSYFPDVVIEIEIPEWKMMQTYKNERDEKKIKYLKTFNEKHNKILKQYKLDCPKGKIPNWVIFKNNY